MSKIKKNLRLILVYSDTHPLEIFNGLLLMFATPSHLFFDECYQTHDIFILIGFASIFIGFCMLYSVLMGQLIPRLNFAKMGWFICVCVMLLILTKEINVDISNYFSYIIQSVASLFVVIRLNDEINSKKKRSLKWQRQLHY